ncbi:glycine/sarcosine/betaine reductase selenoprotein B family protein [Effusibacillus consociatus]|uniref:Glycine/sarcosine/betaine reductase selenoprotein B family protein n=1 Tax=Effusibacillus consociatus TaxID=1117041 RepID=A0ABV9Q478_9BACL
MAVSYIEVTRRRFPDQPPYQWHESFDVPFSSLSKPLTQAKVALLSSGGVFHKNQEGFNPVKNDFTYRVIEKSTNPIDLHILHDSYDHSGAKQDINCVFPYQRLQELEDKRVINQFSQRAFTFMGRIFSKTKLMQELVPALLDELHADQVDAALLVPV